MNSLSEDGRTISDALIKHLYRRAKELTHSESDAWDLVQDTFERALRRRPEGLPPENPERWLRVVLRHLYFDRVRSSQWRAAVRADPGAVETLAAPESSELPLWRTIDPQHVRRSLNRLPAHQRTALLMQSDARLSLREIAGALGVCPATAGTRIHRARNKLRAILHAECADERPAPALPR